MKPYTAGMLCCCRSRELVFVQWPSERLVPVSLHTSTPQYVPDGWKIPSQMRKQNCAGVPGFDCNRSFLVVHKQYRRRDSSRMVGS